MYIIGVNVCVKLKYAKIAKSLKMITYQGVGYGHMLHKKIIFLKIFHSSFLVVYKSLMVEIGRFFSSTLCVLMR